MVSRCSKSKVYKLKNAVDAHLPVGTICEIRDGVYYVVVKEKLPKDYIIDCFGCTSYSKEQVDEMILRDLVTKIGLKGSLLHRIKVTLRKLLIDFKI